MRAAGEIGAALDAEVALQANPADAAWLAPFADELRFLFISGDVSVRAVGEAGTIGVAALPTQKPKCVRCWHRRADVGSDPAASRAVRALRVQHRRAGRGPEVVLMVFAVIPAQAGIQPA